MNVIFSNLVRILKITNQNFEILIISKHNTNVKLWHCRGNTLSSSTSFCSRSVQPSAWSWRNSSSCRVSTLVRLSSSFSVCRHNDSNNTPFSSVSLSLSFCSSVSCAWRSANSCSVAWSSSFVLQANMHSVQAVTSSTLTHYTTVTRMTNTTHNSSQHYILHMLLQESHLHFAYSNSADKLTSRMYDKSVPILEVHKVLQFSFLYHPSKSDWT